MLNRGTRKYRQELIDAIQVIEGAIDERQTEIEYLQAKYDVIQERIKYSNIPEEATYYKDLDNLQESIQERSSDLIKFKRKSEKKLTELNSLLKILEEKAP